MSIIYKFAVKLPNLEQHFQKCPSRSFRSASSKNKIRNCRIYLFSKMKNSFASFIPAAVCRPVHRPSRRPAQRRGKPCEGARERRRNVAVARKPVPARSERGQRQQLRRRVTQHLPAVQTVPLEPIWPHIRNPTRSCVILIFHDCIF